MERVAFLVEETGQRLDCLLNPETLDVTRLGGIRSKGIGSGRLRSGLADDPVHFTGGGRTELVLDLLFDVELVRGHERPTDVRSLTRGLWQLAENSTSEHGGVRPPLIRFVWGKSWNIPGVVAAIAERFDQFSADGSPRRSWLRMRFLRVADSVRDAQEEYESMVASARATEARALLDAGPDPDPVEGLVAVGDMPGLRFDLLATDGLGNPFLWRSLAEFNEVDDPAAVESGSTLAIPRSSGGRRPGSGPGGPSASSALSGSVSVEVGR